MSQGEAPWVPASRGDERPRSGESAEIPIPSEGPGQGLVGDHFTSPGGRAGAVESRFVWRGRGPARSGGSTAGASRGRPQRGAEEGTLRGRARLRPRWEGGGGKVPGKPRGAGARLLTCWASALLRLLLLVVVAIGHKPGGVQGVWGQRWSREAGGGALGWGGRPGHRGRGLVAPWEWGSAQPRFLGPQQPSLGLVVLSAPLGLQAAVVSFFLSPLWAKRQKCTVSGQQGPGAPLGLGKGVLPWVPGQHGWRVHGDQRLNHHRVAQSGRPGQPLRAGLPGLPTLRSIWQDTAGRQQRAPGQVREPRGQQTAPAPYHSGSPPLPPSPALGGMLTYLLLLSLKTKPNQRQALTGFLWLALSKEQTRCLLTEPRVQEGLEGRPSVRGTGLGHRAYFRSFRG